MTWSRPLRAAIIAAVAAVVLAGCANLATFPGRSPEPQEATAPASAPATNTRADYQLDVQAPEPLRKLLVEYLDLARFQNAPAAEAIDATELERLLRAAPSQARGLLETEGYFNAEVSVARAGRDDAGVPRVRIVVEPGVRATIAEVRIDASGDLQAAAARWKRCAASGRCASAMHSASRRGPRRRTPRSHGCAPTAMQRRTGLTRARRSMRRRTGSRSMSHSTAARCSGSARCGSKAFRATTKTRYGA
jgi:hypothetical protein